MSTLMKKLNERVKTKRAAAAPYKGPDKTSANGNRPLTFPTPYHGGKRRWAEEILAAFGPERECVYVEPFSGSAAVLLANDRPYAREILCDTNPHISNVFRCLAWAPEATAFWADWPTTHQDLTARHTWLLRWAVDHVADIEADPDFHDPKAAGWWLWGKSNWIGTEFAIVKGLSAVEKEQIPYAQGPTGQGVQAQRATLPTSPDAPPQSDSRPFAAFRLHGGQGVQVQRPNENLLTAPDGMPHVGIGVGGPTGQGVQAQRTTLPKSSADIPYAPEHGGGRGVNAQRKQAYPDSGGKDATLPTAPPDSRPLIEPKMGGQGVQAQRYDDSLPTAPGKIPHVKEIPAGNGVSAQRHGDILYGGGKGYRQPADVPDAPPQSDSRPSLTDGMRGNGVSVQRRSPLPYPPSAPSPPPEKMPFTDPRGGGNGVQPQRVETPMLDKRPLVQNGGGSGVQPQRDDAGLLPALDKRPMIEPKMGGQGVQSQRYDAGLPVAPDTRPHIEPFMSGQGVQAQRYDDSLPVAHDGMPHVENSMGGSGIQAQNDADISAGPPPKRSPIASMEQFKKRQAQGSAYLPTTPVPLTGDRLRPWFQALAQRLYRVIILNRGWQSGLTSTVLQQTRTARKPPVRVLIDPPYKGVGKLYGMSETEADALAVASWRWAAENGSREGWRIAYACREGDFDAEATALGWTCSKMGIAANHSDNKQEVIWFSPHCLRGGRHTSDTASEVAQPMMFDMGEA